MNHLNSILLEGMIIDGPNRVNLSKPEGKRLVKLEMESDRYYIDIDGERKLEATRIYVQCWGALGDKVLEQTAKGMTIRVVGRIRACKWVSDDGYTLRDIEIVAEHLEFRKGKNGEEARIIEEEDLD